MEQPFLILQFKSADQLLLHQLILILFITLITSDVFLVHSFIYLFSTR